ncbi:acyltransferase family protein [Microvirga sp. 2TAF3]|uniref:acyltransferase family protein n=1 Tax=Microvirga sp. 2TAF3 TaxID=3233014 RepID=UPI003F999FEB
MALCAQTLLTAAPLSSRRSGGIDAARGVLALWVLIFAHLIPGTIYAQGADAVPALLRFLSTQLFRIFQRNAELHPAVLGFIVLSGYCIHRNGFRAERATLRRFVIKRAFRILPVYFLAILAGAIGFKISSSFSLEMASLLTATKEISPFCLLAKTVAAPAFFPGLTSCAYQGNGPIATVMVEIVLYAVYAAAFSALIWRGLSAWWAALCAAAWVIGLVVAWGYPGIYVWWQNFSLWGFLPYWWIGAAFVSPTFAMRVRKSRTLLLLAWSLLTVAILLHSPFGPVLSEVRKLVFALLVGLVVVRLDCSNIRETSPISALGRAGYSLYAFHAPITYALCVAGVSWWQNVIANLGFAFVAYRIVEAPLTRLGAQKAAPQRPAETSATSMAGSA